MTHQEIRTKFNDLKTLTIVGFGPVRTTTDRNGDVYETIPMMVAQEVQTDLQANKASKIFRTRSRAQTRLITHIETTEPEMVKENGWKVGSKLPTLNLELDYDISPRYEKADGSLQEPILNPASGKVRATIVKGEMRPLYENTSIVEGPPRHINMGLYKKSILVSESRVNIPGFDDEADEIIDL